MIKGGQVQQLVYNRKLQKTTGKYRNLEDNQGQQLVYNRSRSLQGTNALRAPGGRTPWSPNICSSKTSTPTTQLCHSLLPLPCISRCIPHNQKLSPDDSQNIYYFSYLFDRRHIKMFTVSTQPLTVTSIREFGLETLTLVHCNTFNLSCKGRGTLTPFRLR